MKKFSEQLYKKSTSVKLRASERTKLRGRVVSYMEYHPLPADLKQQARATTSGGLATEAFTSFKIPFISIARYASAFAVVVLIIVPFMAERSVPGDALYAVKVQFNEEVRSSLALSPYQKVEWETERLNRRIAEARLLASEGRLTDEVEVEVAQAVRNHTENAQREIEVLRTEDADEATLASIQLTTTLEIQSASLRDDEQDTNERNTDSDTSTNLLAITINDSLSKQVQTASSTIPAYEKLMARVEINTTRAYELLNSIDLDENNNLFVDATRRLEDIERTIGEAIALREQEYDSAQKLLVESLQRTQKLVVFITELEVNRTFTLEEFVPVVLTKEEKQAEMNRLQKSVADQSATATVRLGLVENQAVREKIIFSLAEVAALQNTISQTSDFEEAKNLSNNALAMLSSIITLIEQNQVQSGAPGAEATDQATSTEETTTAALEAGTEATQPANQSSSDELSLPENETSPTTTAANVETN